MGYQLNINLFWSVDRLEQELMARIITEVYPLPEREEPAEISHVVSEESEESYAEDKQQAMFGIHQNF